MSPRNVLRIISSQAAIYLVRSRDHAWTSRPSTWLLAATHRQLAIALTLALTGSLMSPLPPLVAAIAIAMLSATALLADYIKIPTFKALARIGSGAKIHHTHRCGSPNTGWSEPAQATARFPFSPRIPSGPPTIATSTVAAVDFTNR